MNEEIIQKPRATEPMQALVSGTSAKEAADAMVTGAPCAEGRSNY